MVYTGVHSTRCINAADCPYITTVMVAAAFSILSISLTSLIPQKEHSKWSVGLVG